MQPISEQIKELYSVSANKESYEFLWFIIIGIALLYVYAKYSEYLDTKGKWIMWTGVGLLIQGIFQAFLKYIM
ncbi:MAG: hypothetical protein PHQ52_07225 [Candidatus Omnitrophica bacterium]|nr:hypothetical protein [Candidatus Omnitrophota bacterium]